MSSAQSNASWSRANSGCQSRTSRRVLALRGCFCDQLLQRVGLRRNVLICLLRRVEQTRSRFFGLLANLAESFGGAGELLGVSGALHAALVGKMRSEIARDLFESRRKSLRQFFLKRRCGGLVRFAASRLRLFLDFLNRGGDLVLQSVPCLGDFFLPLLGGRSALGGDGLRGGFSSCSLNLLARFGEKPSDVARKLQRRVGRARWRREDANVVRTHGRRRSRRWRRVGIRKRNVELGF